MPVVPSETVDKPSRQRIGGKERVKGNRQGSLSRWIKQLFPRSRLKPESKLPVRASVPKLLCQLGQVYG